MVTRDEALRMAHKTFMQLNERFPRKDDGSGYFDKEINACKAALEQQEVGDAEIRQMLNDIVYYQKRVEELEQALKGGVK